MVMSVCYRLPVSCFWCHLPRFQASAASGKGVLPLFTSLFSSVLGQLPQMDYALVQCAGQEAAAACQAEGLAQLRLS